MDDNDVSCNNDNDNRLMKTEGNFFFKAYETSWFFSLPPSRPPFSFKCVKARFKSHYNMLHTMKSQQSFWG